MRITKDPETRRSELVEAAEILFRKKGYRQTSVSDIVGRVGVAQGTFYYYFKSKDNILDAVVSDYVRGYRRALEALIAQDDMDPCRKMEIVANTALALHRCYPRLSDILHSEDHLATHQRYITQSFVVVIPQITAVVEQGRAAGIFHVDCPRESAEMLVYAFGYAEEAIAAGRDEARSRRLVRAAEEMLTRVLGVEEGRLHLNLSGAGNVLQLEHMRVPKPEA